MINIISKYIIKNKLKINYIKSKELFNNFKNSIIKNNMMFNNIIKNYFLIFFFFKYSKLKHSLNFKNKLRTRCLFGTNSHSINNKLSLNRIFLRKFISFGYINGFFKSSW